MTPIYWKDNNTEVETTSSDSNWFNYDNALWANAKTTDGSYETTQWADYHTFFEGIFDRTRFMDLLKNFILLK